MTSVSGNSRDPLPPARTTPFSLILPSSSSVVRRLSGYLTWGPLVVNWRRCYPPLVLRPSVKSRSPNVRIASMFG